MPGRPDYQTLAATLPSQSLLNFTEAPASQINAGGSEQYTFYPPAGTIGKLTNLWLSANAPAGAASGIHQMVATPQGGPNVLIGESTYAAGVSYLSGAWNTNSAQTPPAAAGADQSWPIGNRLIVDSTHGLNLSYTNNTNVATTETRNYMATMLVEDQP